MKIKIYADGADINQMIEMHERFNVSGFTTNPSLMKKAGITNYREFAMMAISKFPDKPISFEVFSDDFKDMEKEAYELASLGNNVFVKIPVTNSTGEPSYDLIKTLSDKGINLNITAIFTKEQVEAVVNAVNPKAKTIVSVFAGRIADAGVDPLPLMKDYAKICHTKENVELLWASPREALNIIQADESGSDIITCTSDILNKSKNFHKDLKDYSLETVKMFYDDSKALGFKIID